ncbi:MAG: enoyl-CoA hydratase/isomerase family protein [Bacillota bacterium]
MQLNCFLYEVQDSILILTMNRPQVRNAWNWEMHEEFFKVLQKLNEDDSLRVMILTGAPPAFCSGTDLKAFASGRGPDLPHPGSMMELMHELKKPMIAAINGAAIGMGMTIPLLCDIRIAAENAMMCYKFVEVGLVPEAGSPYMLPRIVGLGRAMELCLTARTFSAQEALSMGLVTEVLPDDQLMPRALEIAKTIASKREHTIRLTREMLYKFLDTDYYEELRQEPGYLAEAVRLSFGENK